MITGIEAYNETKKMHQYSTIVFNYIKEFNKMIHSAIECTEEVDEVRMNILVNDEELEDLRNYYRDLEYKVSVENNIIQIYTDKTSCTFIINWRKGD